MLDDTQSSSASGDVGHCYPSIDYRIRTMNGLVMLEPFPILKSNMTGGAFKVTVTQTGLVKMKVLKHADGLTGATHVWMDESLAASQSGWPTRVYEIEGVKFILAPISEVKIVQNGENQKLF